MYCVYDIGAKMARPGRADGQYVKQCKNAAVEGTQPPLCYAHARKSLLALLVEGQSKIMKLKEIPLRSSVPSANVYDPKTILITGAEYDWWVKNQGTCLADLKDVKGGLFGRDQAICKALGTAGFHT